MLIRILRSPVGDAPDWVRARWIGLTLPTPQNGPRARLVLDPSQDRPSALARIALALRGRARRMSGYAVHAVTALEALERSDPAAAEWYRTHSPAIFARHRFVIFDADCCEPLPPQSLEQAHWGARAIADSFPASPGRIAVLWLGLVIVRLATAFVFPDSGTPWLSATLAQAFAPVLAAVFAAWVLRGRELTLNLVTALLTFAQAAAIATLVFMIMSPDPAGAHGLTRAFLALAVVSLIWSGLAGLRGRVRRIAAIVLALGTMTAGDFIADADDAFLELSIRARHLIGHDAPPEAAEPAVSPIDEDVLWGAQPRLLTAQVAALKSPVAGTTNVWSVAVAASGRQDLFSREAHEALRVIGTRFGAANRGGVMLSNGAPDRMNAPLATRGSIATSLAAIGRRSDRRRDLVFVYLASHGSRTAELESDLPDTRTVQAISAESTAEALRQAGVGRRVIVVSACFAASWIPALASDDTIVLAAAAKDRTSFGCDDSRRMTLFGESLLGSLARRDLSLHAAFDDARRKIAAEEARQKTTPSDPQAFVGRNMRGLWDAP